MRRFVVPLAGVAIGLVMIYAVINFGDRLPADNLILAAGGGIMGTGFGYLLKAAHNLGTADSRK